MGEVDPLGLAITVGFVIAALMVIPFNGWLDARQKRRDARRRNQAHPWRR